jgi:hypothetical protein
LRHDNLYEIFQHKRARFFYKWFINGGAVSLFTGILNFGPEKAEQESTKLCRSAESYCRGLYQEELRYGAYRKSFAAFLDEPRVIAVNINYILKTLCSEYPNFSGEFIGFIKTNIFGIGVRPKPFFGISMGPFHELSKPVTADQ